MDISVNIGEHKFNYRVAAIIRHNDEVLAFHNIGNDKMTLIGGRVQDGENSIEALQREIQEEIGIQAEHVKPVAVLENFFTTNEQNYHEILMIHEMKFVNEEDYQKEIVPIEERKIGISEFLWVNVKKELPYKITPKQLVDLIIESKDFTHIVNYD